MSFPPFDSSAPSRTPPPMRPVYPQLPDFGAYDQPPYGPMYADMPPQLAMRYPPTPALYPPQTEPYAAPPPSFSPTAAHFAPHPYATGNPDGIPFEAPSVRRRFQSTGGAHSPPVDGHYPPARRLSAERHMPQESFVPSQHPEPVPVPRPGPIRRSSTSAADSALALEKPYMCDICETRFARQHDCRRHRETHAVNASGEKPHHCVVCGKSFTRKDALKRHSNQKGCDAMGGYGYHASGSARSSASPQQVAGTFYPVGSLPRGSFSSH